MLNVHHVTGVEQRSPGQESNPGPSANRSDVQTSELRETGGELGHISGSYMTCVLHTANISNVTS